jgi:hypothetical protein
MQRDYNPTTATTEVAHLLESLLSVQDLEEQSNLVVQGPEPVPRLLQQQLLQGLRRGGHCLAGSGRWGVGLTVRGVQMCATQEDGVAVGREPAC